MVAGFRVLLFLVVLLILIFFVDVVPQAVVKHELDVVVADGVTAPTAAGERLAAGLDVGRGGGSGDSSGAAGAVWDGLLDCAALVALGVSVGLLCELAAALSCAGGC